MANNGTIEIGSQFQHAFARVFEEQIQQLIQDSRQEALATAKEILRESALNNVLEAVVTGNKEKEEDASSMVDGPRPVQPKRKKAKPEKALQPKELRNAPPALNDRILEEIEAIREQIQRNELLLSQIKPFVQPSKVQKE